MAKFNYYPERVANMLEKLWFVSDWFTRSEYETFVEAAHWYFAHIKGASLSIEEIEAFEGLKNLVLKHYDKLKKYSIETNFYC